MQQDGNLVLYRVEDEGDDVPIWHSMTDGSGSDRAIMQQDGNFVLYNSNDDHHWASWTNDRENEGAFLRLEDDGSLVIISADEQSTLWIAD